MRSRRVLAIRFRIQKHASSLAGKRQVSSTLDRLIRSVGCAKHDQQPKLAFQLSFSGSESVAKGNCLCGAIAWQLSAPFPRIGHCHCTMCQKAHGASFASYVSIPVSQFTLEAGESAVKVYQSSSDFKRAFCNTCGSVVPVAQSDGVVHVPAGGLQADFVALGAQEHIFVDSRAAWTSLHDGIPAFSAYPARSRWRLCVTRRRDGQSIQASSHRCQAVVCVGGCTSKCHNRSRASTTATVNVAVLPDRPYTRPMALPLAPECDSPRARSMCTYLSCLMRSSSRKLFVATVVLVCQG